MPTESSRDLADELEQAEVEPIDPDNDSEASNEAIDDQIVRQPFRVIYQTNNFLLPQIKDLIATGEDVNLRPEYQRRLRWTIQQKSLLIESLLLNVPVPPVFFYENDLARYEVMDGQQRLNSIKEFLNNEFSLRGLQIISTLNGKNYARLPPKVKRSLDRASISAIVLLQESRGSLKKAGSHRVYELRRFVFERLNTGGKRLTAQEIRNAVYGGEFNNLIVRLSRDQTFTRIWGIPPYVENDYGDYFEDESRQKNFLYRTMGDCQLVLRYFALSTFAALAGIKLPEKDREGQPMIFDSYDISPVLFGTGPDPRDTWYYMTEDELLPGAIRYHQYKFVFNMRGDMGAATGAGSVDSNYGWKGESKYVATVPQTYDLWQDPQERYDIFMNNFTEHTWMGPVMSEQLNKVMKTFMDYPPRKLQSYGYTGPISISSFQKYQWLREQLQKEGVSISIPGGN